MTIYLTPSFNNTIREMVASKRSNSIISPIDNASAQKHEVCVLTDFPQDELENVQCTRECFEKATEAAELNIHYVYLIKKTKSFF